MCGDKINPESIIDMNFFGVTFGQMFSSCVFIVDATITIYISTPPFKKTVLMLPAYIKKIGCGISRQAMMVLHYRTTVFQRPPCFNYNKC